MIDRGTGEKRGSEGSSQDEKVGTVRLKKVKGSSVLSLYRLYKGFIPSL